MTVEGAKAGPLVSVMIITYNQLEYVEETVCSAVNQDYPNLEVIVSDDGSTDGTAAKLRELESKYLGRLRVLTNNKNVGITRNSNRGLSTCNGKFIAFQGGDDVFLPGKISAQVEWFMESEGRVLCFHDVEVFDSISGRTVCHYRDIAPLVKGKGADHVIRHLKLGAATATMVRRAAIPDRMFDERLPVVSDWKLWIDILVDGGEYGFVDGVYARYRRHGGNTKIKFADRYRADCYSTIALTQSAYPQYSRSIRHGYARVTAIHAVYEAFEGRRWNAARLLLLSQRNSLLQVKPVLGVCYASLPIRVRVVVRRLLSRWIPELDYIHS